MRKTFGNYHLEIQISRKATHSTYLASLVDDAQQKVIIKIFDAPELRQRADDFVQSAEILKRLKHAYILPVLEIGVEKDIPYLLTEYAPNGSLREYLARAHKYLPLQEALKLLFQLGQALAYAHERDVVHGNLRPENIYFNRDNEIQLTGFSPANLFEKLAACRNRTKRAMCYIAPEQLVGKSSKASDQYALGCVAYELFSGHPPFTATNWSMFQSKQHKEAPHVLTSQRPDIPAYINAAILQALAKEPAERHKDLFRFISALNMAYAAPPIVEDQYETQPQLASIAKELNASAPEHEGVLTFQRKASRSASNELRIGSSYAAITPIVCR